MRTAKTLIRLVGCPGRSESSLGAHVILFVLSCAGYFFLSSLGPVGTFFLYLGKNRCLRAYADLQNAMQSYEESQ